MIWNGKGLDGLRCGHWLTPGSRSKAAFFALYTNLHNFAQANFCKFVNKCAKYSLSYIQFECTFLKHTHLLDLLMILRES